MNAPGYALHSVCPPTLLSISSLVPVWFQYASDAHSMKYRSEMIFRSDVWRRNIPKMKHWASFWLGPTFFDAIAFKSKNRITGLEAHLVMADRTVSWLGFNRYPWCSYTKFGRHLGVEFIGLHSSSSSIYSSTLYSRPKMNVTHWNPVYR